MLRTTEQLNELREQCSESVMLNATFYPSVLIKEIGYLACKRWLSGETNVNPLAEIPLNYNRTNTGPKYEQGILQALNEVVPVEPPKVWVDPEFLAYLEERESKPLELYIVKQREGTGITPIFDKSFWNIGRD